MMMMIITYSKPSVEALAPGTKENDVNFYKDTIKHD